MNKQFVYTSRFGKKGTLVVESAKTDKLFTIREALKALKKSLREEGEDGEPIVDEATPAENAQGIADIIDKVEDLVVDAIGVMGATDPTTQELIGTVGTLEGFQDEEEIMASIEAASAESDAIIEEDFEPVYDTFGNVVNYSAEDDIDVMDDGIIDDGMSVDGLDDDLGYDPMLDDDEDFIDGMYEKFKAKKKAIAEKKALAGKKVKK